MNVSQFLAKTPGIVIDGGANKGDWTAAAKSAWPDARIILFEPAASNRAVLAARKPDIEIVGSALSDVEGQMTLYTDFDGSGNASLHQRNLEHQGLQHEPIGTVDVTTSTPFAARRRSTTSTC